MVASSSSNFDSKHIFPSEEFDLSATEKFVSGGKLSLYKNEEGYFPKENIRIPFEH